MDVGDRAVGDEILQRLAIGFVMDQVAAIGRVDIVLQRFLAHDADRLSLPVDHREEGTLLVQPEGLEHILHVGVDGQWLDELHGQPVPGILIARCPAVAQGELRNMIVLFQNLRQIRGRPGNEIALRQIAADIPAGNQLGLGLHPFGDHNDAQHMRQIDDGRDEQLLLRVAFDAGDEETVNLHLVGLIVVEQLQP